MLDQITAQLTHDARIRFLELVAQQLDGAPSDEQLGSAVIAAMRQNIALRHYCSPEATP
jgi:hypothetical protein